MAVVGGSDAAPGEFPSVAEVTIGQAFLCTGTLIAPNYVLTAGPLRLDHRRQRRRLARRLARRSDRRPHRLQQARPGREGPGLAASPSSPTTWLNSGYDITLLKLSTQLDQGADATSSARAARACGRRARSRRSSASAPPPRAATRPTRSRRRRCRSRPTPTARGAYSDFDADDDGLRRLPAGRHRHLPGRLRRPDVRPRRRRRAARSSARRASARAARSPASPASTPAWATTRLREWIRSVAPAGVD